MNFVMLSLNIKSGFCWNPCQCFFKWSQTLIPNSKTTLYHLRYFWGARRCKNLTGESHSLCTCWKGDGGKHRPLNFTSFPQASSSFQGSRPMQISLRPGKSIRDLPRENQTWSYHLPQWNKEMWKRKGPWVLFTFFFSEVVDRAFQKSLLD